MTLFAAAYVTGAFVLAGIFLVAHTGDEQRATLDEEPGYLFFLLFLVAFWPIAVVLIALHEKKDGAS